MFVIDEWLTKYFYKKYNCFISNKTLIYDRDNSQSDIGVGGISKTYKKIKYI